LEKAESVEYARELEIAVAGLKEMKKRGVKVTVLDLNRGCLFDRP
jgi:hypothetical protein